MGVLVWDHSLQVLHNQIEFIKLYKILNVYQAKIEQDMACQKLQYLVYMKSGNPDKTIKLFLIYRRLSTRFVHAVKVTWHQCSLMLLWLKKNWDGKLNVDLMKCVSSQRSAMGSLFQVFGW